MGGIKKMRQWASEIERKKYSHKVATYIHISLQLECYANDTGDDSIYETPGFKTLNELRNNKENYTNDELFKMAELIIKQFNETIDKIGRDKFITYEDGDVEYVWKNKHKEENSGRSKKQTRTE